MSLIVSKLLSGGDFNNQKLVNLANGTASTDAAAFGQLGVISAITPTGGTLTVTGNLTVASGVILTSGTVTGRSSLTHTSTVDATGQGGSGNVIGSDDSGVTLKIVSGQTAIFDNDGGILSLPTSGAVTIPNVYAARVPAITNVGGVTSGSNTISFLTGQRIEPQGPLSNASTTVLIGLDIGAMSGGTSTNYGIRIAPPLGTTSSVNQAINVDSGAFSVQTVFPAATTAQTGVVVNPNINAPAGTTAVGAQVGAQFGSNGSTPTVTEFSALKTSTVTANTVASGTVITNWYGVNISAQPTITNTTTTVATGLNANVPLITSTLAYGIQINGKAAAGATTQVGLSSTPAFNGPTSSTLNVIRSGGGTFGSNGTTPTITEFANIHVVATASGTASAGTVVTNWYGQVIETQATLTNTTITNAYGLSIGTPTGGGTTNTGLFVGGGTGASTGTITAILRAGSSQTGDILSLQSSTPTTLFSFNANGSFSQGGSTAATVYDYQQGTFSPASQPTIYAYASNAVLKPTAASGSAVGFQPSTVVDASAAGGTVAAAYGIVVPTVSKLSTGTITTAYGIQVATPTAATTNIAIAINSTAATATGYQFVGAASQTGSALQIVSSGGGLVGGWSGDGFRIGLGVAPSLGISILQGGTLSSAGGGSPTAIYQNQTLQPLVSGGTPSFIQILGTFDTGSAGGTVGNGIGIYVASLAKTGANAVTSMYGIYINAPTGGTGNSGITVVGSGAVSGAFSKGSGTFLIDDLVHPTRDTLMHGFVEAPYYELIYSDTVTLANGRAEVSIDDFARMNRGVFAKLNRRIRAFVEPATEDEDDWTQVRAKVVGDTVVIWASDKTSTMRVHWMVVGERNDPYVHSDIDPYTDKDGRLQTTHRKRERDPGRTLQDTRQGHYHHPQAYGKESHPHVLPPDPKEK